MNTYHINVWKRAIAIAQVTVDAESVDEALEKVRALDEDEVEWDQYLNTGSDGVMADEDDVEIEEDEEEDEDDDN